jgi:hypothetical protein
MSQLNLDEFTRLQDQLGLPLPEGLPRFVFEDGLQRLQAMQAIRIDEHVIQEFRSWVDRVRRCFGFRCLQERTQER